MKLEDVKFKFNFRSLVTCEEEFGVDFTVLANRIETDQKLGDMVVLLAVGMGKTKDETIDIIDELTENDVAIADIMEKCVDSLMKSKILGDNGGSHKAPKQPTPSKKK